MGHGIALACLQGGCEVTIVSRRPESVERGIHLVRHGPFGLDRAVERGKLDLERAEALAAKLTGTTDYPEGLNGADLVFESVPETVDEKVGVLRLAERLASPDAIFASGTSAIMIAELSAALESPGRLCGTHWFYPANVMPLVEVANGDTTAPATLDAVVEFLRSIGKRPVVVGDSPGFFMTRFINLFIAEAIHLVELGVARIQDVDEMVKTGLGWPLGVFELLDDTASFDSWYHAQEYLWRTCGERYAVPPLARKVFVAGYRGSPALKPDSRGGWYEFLGAPRASG